MNVELGLIKFLFVNTPSTFVIDIIKSTFTVLFRDYETCKVFKASEIIKLKLSL